MNYLYNGIKLPELPEWDKEKHPYAYIYYSPGVGIIVPAKYCLLFTSEPYYGVSTDGDYCIGHQVGDISYVVTKPITDESTWESKFEITTQGVENPVDTVVWANFDILNEDGSVFLKASDPVPVPVLPLGRLNFGLGNGRKPFPLKFVHDKKWKVKTWNGFTPEFAERMWTDGNNIYYSDCTYGEAWEIIPVNYVLKDGIWEEKVWNGLSAFYGSSIWSDGNNIYCSENSSQFVLNGDTWEEKVWDGNRPNVGMHIWSDGENIYYSFSSDQYVLNGDTWEEKTWNIDGISSSNIWNDGTNVYYRNSLSTPDKPSYVLKNGIWEEKIWDGFTDITPNGIWTDGFHYYNSYFSEQYVLNGNIWEPVVWEGFAEPYGNRMWTDGTNIYISFESTQYVLEGHAVDDPPPSDIDHTAMVQGWIVGKRLAAQRSKA